MKWYIVFQLPNRVTFYQRFSNRKIFWVEDPLQCREFRTEEEALLQCIQIWGVRWSRNTFGISVQSENTAIIQSVMDS